MPHASGKVRLMNVRWLTHFLMTCVSLSCALNAQGAAFEGDFARTPHTYELSLDTRIHHATRQNFYQPIYLFHNKLERIRTEAVVTTLAMDLYWTERLVLHFDIPVIARHVVANFSAVQVSKEQTLMPQTREFRQTGLGDPTLSIGWLAYQAANWDIYTRLGTTIPLDDNSGHSVFPTRIPTSTGQNALFAGIGINASLNALRVNVDYRGDFFPGNTASYLVHQVSSQTWVTGALTSFHRHLLRASFYAHATKNLRFELSPGWRVTWLPKPVLRGSSLEDNNLSVIEDIYVEASFRWNFSKRYRLKFWYRTSLRDATSQNPFFPIELGLQGGGLTLTATRW